MRTLPIFSVLFAVCPLSFGGILENTFGGKKYVYESKPGTFDEQVTRCHSMGMELVMIRTEAENNFILHWITGNEVYIGAVCDPNTSRYKWMDNSLIKYKRFYDGHEVCSTGNKLFIDDDKTWTRSDGTSAYGALCAEIPAGGYRMVYMNNTLRTLNATCDRYNLTLPHLYSLEDGLEIGSVVSNMTGKGDYELFIGAVCNTSSGRFNWDDGSEFIYSNYHSQDPCTSGDGLVIDLQNMRWKKVNGTSKHHAFCVHKNRTRFMTHSATPYRNYEEEFQRLTSLGIENFNQTLKLIQDVKGEMELLAVDTRRKISQVELALKDMTDQNEEMRKLITTGSGKSATESSGGGGYTTLVAIILIIISFGTVCFLLIKKYNLVDSLKNKNQKNRQTTTRLDLISDEVFINDNN